MSIGRVEVDNIFDAVFWDELEVVHGEIAVWIDNTITLVVVDVAECEEGQKTRLTGTGLTDNINVTRAVAAIHTELVFDAAEIGKAEGGNVFIKAWVAGKHWKLGWWLCGLARCPNDIRSFHVGMWKVIDASKLGDI